MMGNATNFDKPSNFGTKTETKTEVIQSIFIIISRKITTAISPPHSISWAVVPIVAESATNHA